MDHGMLQSFTDDLLVVHYHVMVVVASAEEPDGRGEVEPRCERMDSSGVHRRTELVCVWFSPAEKAELEEAAQNLGMSVGALVWSVLHATHAIYIDAEVE